MLVGASRGGIAVPTGAVMVAGGGIAGVQALLNLADQGLRRCLVQAVSTTRGNRHPVPKGKALIA